MYQNFTSLSGKWHLGEWEACVEESRVLSRDLNAYHLPGIEFSKHLMLTNYLRVHISLYRHENKTELQKHSSRWEFSD